MQPFDDIADDKRIEPETDDDEQENQDRYPGHMDEPSLFRASVQLLGADKIFSPVS
jgi:hypothetical protein